MKKLIVANWKMNPAKGSEARKMFLGISKVANTLKKVETVVCPPLVYLESLGALVESRSCVLGAQDAFWEHSGAYTGQVSPDMVFNTKARYVIVGHSERRAMGETDEQVNMKIRGILQFPLIPIVCVGELVRDDDSQSVKILKNQLKCSLAGLSVDQLSRIVVAYEPVWAIGKGPRGACSPADCREMVHVIRQILADMMESADLARKVAVIYGAAVAPENISSFLQEGEVHGVLVGHASLDPKTFNQILKIAEKAP